MTTNPLKQANHFKKLEAARAEADQISRVWWSEWKEGRQPNQSALNAAARKLDELAPGEGSRLETTLALNALADMQRKFAELAAESAAMRSRLVGLEKTNGENIVRSTDSPGKDTAIGASSGEGI